MDEIIVDESFLEGMIDFRALFSSRWTPSVMVALANGPLRRAEILDTVRSYSVPPDWADRATLHDSILTRTLARMTAAGLLTRVEEPGVFPPHVRYGLTPEAAVALRALAPLVAWAREHAGLMARARAELRGAPP